MSLPAAVPGTAASRDALSRAAVPGTAAPRPFPTAEPLLIALVRPRTGLGDVLCTVPALRALRAAAPRAHVTWVTYAEMAPALAQLPSGLVDDLLPFPGIDGIPERPADPAAWDDFVATARARRFDLALQLYGARDAANTVTDALGAARTAGFFVAGARTVDLTTFVPYPEHLHEIDRHLHALAHLGVAPLSRTLELRIDGADEAVAAAVRERFGLQRGRYALVHPGATSPSRRWPAGRFAQTAARLAQDGLRVAVTGVPGEERTVAAVVDALRPTPAADLCGATTLGAFACLVRDAAVTVTNDTGTGHVAAAMDARCVAVWLSGDPRRFGHVAGRRRIARRQVQCNPCSHLACPIDHRCATRLPVADVVALARSAQAAA